MTRADQMALLDLFCAVCTRSLAELFDLVQDRIARGTFDEGDAEFLKGASLDVIEGTHDLQIAAAMAEQPAQEDMH